VVPTVIVAGATLSEVGASANGDAQLPHPMQVHPCDFSRWPSLELLRWSCAGIEWWPAT